jgi:hypothetical protein
LATPLDCESVETAVDSLAGILKMEPEELIQKLRGFEFDRLPEKARHRAPFQDLLLFYALSVRRGDLRPPSSVCWFHGTRVKRDTTFGQGILPLSESVEHIWEWLGGIARQWSPPGEWAAFRAEMPGQGGAQYHRRLDCGLADGPYAVLVREVLLRPSEAGSHDFLGVPEIIEDICMSYKDGFGHNLHDEFVAATRPCIVKFVSREVRGDAVAAALTYVHRRLRNEDLFLPECNACFDGERRRVPPEDVLKIDWLESNNR